MTIKNTENQGYVAPEMQAIEICSEGLLCQSGEFSIQSLLHDEEQLNF